MSDVAKEKNEIKSIEVLRYYFIIMILFGLVYIGICLFKLPSEKDEVFSRINTESNQYEDIIYKGEFVWVCPDGGCKIIDVPGNYEVSKGETMVIETTLPRDITFDYIEIRSSQQIIRMYVDGQLRTEYDTRNTRPFGNQISSRYIFCPIISTDAGKILRIEISSATEMYSGFVNEVFACSKYEFWSYISTYYALRPIFGVVLLVVGLFTIVISVCIRFAFKSRNSLEYLGWCVSFAGTWLICESKFRQLISANGSATNNICYFVIMLAPIAILLYINDVQRGKYHKAYTVLSMAAVLNVAVSTILQFNDIADFDTLLPISHVILVAVIILVIVTFILDIKDKSIMRYIATCVGMIVVFACVIIETVLAYVITSFSGLFLMIGGLGLVLSGIIMTIGEIKEVEVNRQKERALEQKKNSEAMLIQLIRTLSNTIEAKDDYLRGHSSRVAEYTVAIARKLGMDEEKISKLWYAATLHDLGKIGVPDSILNKPSRLTDEEFNIIKTHTSIGAGILANVEMVSYTADIALHHHERYDGHGYPDGLKGEEISLEARIVAVADAYDAMNSNRIYRKALSRDIIVSDMIRNKGIQFDAHLVDVFIELLEAGTIDELEERVDAAGVDDNPFDMDMPNAQDVKKILSLVSETMINVKTEEEIDALTGLLTRRKGEEIIVELMREKRGALLFLDMDNLKTVNDIYGHKAGDNVIQILGKVIKDSCENGQACRLGGDEFLIFLSEVDEAQTIFVIENIMESFHKCIRKDPAANTATLSIGACLTNQLSDYSDVFNKVDKALYYIKQRGKDGYYLYKEEKVSELERSSVDINILKKSIMSAGKYEGALDLGYREFAKLYEYISKVCQRYSHTCNIVIVTLDTKQDSHVYIDDMEYAMMCMERAINSTIRNVDICTRYTSVQFLIILLEAGNDNLDMIMSRIKSNFYKMYEDPNSSFDIKYEVSSIAGEESLEMINEDTRRI